MCQRSETVLRSGFHDTKAPSFLPSFRHACTSAVWFYHGGAYLPNEMETAG